MNILSDFDKDIYLTVEWGLILNYLGQFWFLIVQSVHYQLEIWILFDFYDCEMAEIVRTWIWSN